MKSLVAYERIRDMILVGEKLPGSRLTLSDLEQELGIGRGPIREALMRLDRSGLVKNVPYKGALVASPPKRKEIYILFEVRMDLEARLMEEAMGKLTSKDIAELERLHLEMSNLDKSFYNLDRKFHELIYQSADMPHIFAIVEKLIVSVEAFLTLYRQEIQDCQRFVQEHGQILDAIRSNDPAKAAETMRKNIHSGLDVAERTFSKIIATE